MQQSSVSYAEWWCNSNTYHQITHDTYQHVAQTMSRQSSDLIRPDRGSGQLGAVLGMQILLTPAVMLGSWKLRPGGGHHEHLAPVTRSCSRDLRLSQSEARAGVLVTNESPELGSLWPMRARSGVWSRGMWSDISHTAPIIRSQLLRIIAALIRDGRAINTVRAGLSN